MNRRFAFLTTSFFIAAVLGYFLGKSNPDIRTFENRGNGPLIGIASLTSDSYTLAVREAGGIPIVLPNGDGNPKQVEEYLHLLDGLLMPGGADIDPANWGEEPHPTTTLLSEDRYQFEKALISAWVNKTEKPLLGICLGAQWINVIHGGSLIQDIPSEYGVDHRDTTHPVSLDESSKLFAIYGENEFEVNSMHHQAVREIGKGLRAVAASPDGIIEATESTDPDRFLIGVQWHPEQMIAEDAKQARLFRAFIEAATQAKGERLPSKQEKTP